MTLGDLAEKIKNFIKGWVDFTGENFYMLSSLALVIFFTLVLFTVTQPKVIYFYVGGGLLYYVLRRIKEWVKPEELPPPIPPPAGKYPGALVSRPWGIVEAMPDPESDYKEQNKKFWREISDEAERVTGSRDFKTGGPG